MDFKDYKIIIWGNVSPRTNTYGWIHEGFYRAFKFLGYDVVWVENSKKNFANILSLKKGIILTEGTADSLLNPTALDPSVYFLIHNCDIRKYMQRTFLFFQAFTNQSAKHILGVEPYVFHYPDNVAIERNVAYMPWATDLLPHEIEFICPLKETVFNWVGTIEGGGAFSNKAQIDEARIFLEKRGIKFKQYGGIPRFKGLLKPAVSREKHIDLIRRSIISPALQGDWQCKVHYIPCRLFKNISYSALGLSNNEGARRLFPDDEVVVDTNISSLLETGLSIISNPNKFEAMVRKSQRNVRENHTFVSRIDFLLKSLEHYCL